MELVSSYSVHLVEWFYFRGFSWNFDVFYSAFIRALSLEGVRFIIVPYRSLCVILCLGKLFSFFLFHFLVKILIAIKPTSH